MHSERWFACGGRRVARLLALTAGLWLSQAAVVRAAPSGPDSARALAYAGIEAYAVADYQKANEKLERAFQLAPAPSVGLWSARTLVKLGRLVDAEQRYRAVLALEVVPSDPAIQRSAKVDAAGEFADLLPRIPSIAIKLRGATFDEVRLRIDGVDVAVQASRGVVRVDPGRHVVLGTRGRDEAVELVTLAESEGREVWLTFPEASASLPSSPGLPSHPIRASSAALDVRTSGEASPSLRNAGWVMLGVGGAGVLTGVVAHLVARGEREDVIESDRCAAAACFSDTAAAHSSYSTWRTVRLATLLSGGLASAAGVTLLIAGSGHSARDGAGGSMDLALRIGPAAAWLDGSF